uniref:HORMA domain-containing protein n=1 Tax=Globodera pallida TaxID=36090 RepID=A0A183BM70_GLOPA
MEIANIVYVSSDEILYPVPRSLYCLSDFEAASMSKSLRNKMTTVLMEDTIVSVQVDPNTSEVNCMYKGGNMLGIVKRGMDWVMEVDVAVSDEQFRRVFVCSAYLSGKLVESLVNLNGYEPNKPYKGFVKLEISHKTVEDLACKSIHDLIHTQKLFKQAEQSCFLFTLISICDAEEPNIAVVYEAPWQSVKRSIVLTPAQVGDGPEDEAVSLPPSEEPKTTLAKYLVVQGQTAGTSVDRNDDEADDRQQNHSAEQNLTDFSVRPIAECLSSESIEQIKRVINEAAVGARA